MQINTPYTKERTQINNPSTQTKNTLKSVLKKNRPLSTMHANYTNSLSLTFTTCIIVYIPFSYQFTVKVIIVYNLEWPFNFIWLSV